MQNNTIINNQGQIPNVRQRIQIIGYNALAPYKENINRGKAFKFETIVPLISGKLYQARIMSHFSALNMQQSPNSLDAKGNCQTTITIYGQVHFVNVDNYEDSFKVFAYGGGAVGSGMSFNHAVNTANSNSFKNCLICGLGLGIPMVEDEEADCNMQNRNNQQMGNGNQYGMQNGNNQQMRQIGSGNQPNMQNRNTWGQQNNNAWGQQNRNR